MKIESFRAQIDLITAVLVLILIIGTIAISLHTKSDVFYLEWKMDQFSLNESTKTIDNNSFLLDNQYYTIHGYKNNSILALNVPTKVNIGETFTIKYIIGATDYLPVHIKICSDNHVIKEYFKEQSSTTAYTEYISLNETGIHNVSVIVNEVENLYSQTENLKDRQLQIYYLIIAN